MPNLPDNFSPKLYARIGGIAYLVIIIAGALGELFIRGKLVVAGDAQATANNISASPLLWRLGIAGDLVMHLCDIVVMLVFYTLLRPVNRNIALMALLFNFTQTAVLVANKLNLLVPLFLLDKNAGYMTAFDPAQIQALSYVFIRAHAYGFGNGLIFFGVYCIVLGYLIYKSEFFPKIFGILMPIAGICYLINSFALILSPALAGKLFPAILLPPFVAELSICLWLIIKGVNVQKWNEKAVVEVANSNLRY